MDTSFVPFDELTPRALHAALRLRAQVFAVEQNCVYCDPDEADLDSLHVLVRDAGELVAYARIQETPQGARIGRVVTSSRVRGQGVGHELMRLCLERIGERPVWLSAQDHLRGYYRAHGFEPVGQVFMEDGIPHVRMERVPRA